MGGARPSTWAKYSFCNLAIKTINSGMPTELAAEMMKNTYRERRRPGRLKCYDNSLRRIRRQHPRNRLTDLNEVELDIPSSASDDVIRIRLKKLLGIWHPSLVRRFFPLGRGTQTLQNPSFSSLLASWVLRRPLAIPAYYMSKIFTNVSMKKKEDLLMLTTDI